MVFTPRPVRIVLCALAAGLVAWLAAAPAMAQVIDNKGREFLMAFLPNVLTPTVQLHLTADAQTSVTVQYPAVIPTFTTTVAVTPGAVTIVNLPANAAQLWTSNVVSGNTVLATSDKEFVAYMINVAGATSDAALALPVDALNTEYIALDWPVSGPEFAVYAPFDETSVTITPKSAIGSRLAGIPFSVLLNRGQAYFATGSGTLSGTTISASRPVGVTNGNSCTQVVGAGGSGACDHIFEVAQPVQSWGNSVPVANLPNRSFGSIYRIVVSEQNTQVELDGTSIGGALSPGAVLQTLDLTGNHLFTANHPIYVAQFMTGLPSLGPNTDKVGDPAMGNMVPSGQYGNHYTFATLSQAQFPSQFLTVIADDRDLASITLDGTLIGATAFSAIGSTGLSAALLSLVAGTHNTASTHPHGITVEGFGSFDSYLYPGGAQFAFINAAGDANPPLCSLTEGDPGFFTGVAQDNRPSEDSNGNGRLDAGEDLNANGEIDKDTGIFSVQLLEGAENLELVVAPFIPGDGRVTFQIQPVESGAAFSGSVRASDGAGNTCERSTGEGGTSGDFPGVTFAGWGDDVEVHVGVDSEEQEIRTAYVALQSEGVKILDVTDPDAIATLGSYDPGTCLNGKSPVDFFADDVTFVESRSALFVAAGRCGVIVLDVSNPAAPTLIGRYDTPVWAEAVEVDTSGSGVIGYIADHNGGLVIVDFTNLFNKTKPSAPKRLGGIGSGKAWGTGASIDVALLQSEGLRFAFVAASQGLRVVDVSTPKSPRLIGSFNTTPTGSPPGVPQDITLSKDGRTAFVANWQAGLLAIDVSDRSKPLLLQQISTVPGLAYYESEIAGSFVFATEGKAGLRTFAWGTDGLQPIGGADPVPIAGGNGWAWDVQVVGGVAYVTYGILEDGTGGLAVIELTPQDF